MRQYSSPLFIFLLLLVSPGISWAQQETIRLKVSVTNTSLDESREIAVDLDLPKELTKNDIVSSDGLQIDTNDATKALRAKGKVTLQPAETTFFYIITRDVWGIPSDEIQRLRAEIDAIRLSTNEYYVQQHGDEAIQKLDIILDQQKVKPEDTIAYIHACRENREKFEAIKNGFLAMRAVYENKRDLQRKSIISVAGKSVIAIALVVFLTAAFFFINKNKNKIIKGAREFQLQDYLKIAQLFNPVDIQCKLLINQDDGPMAEGVSISSITGPSQGRIYLFLEEAYRSQTVLESKIPLVNQKNVVTLRGSILWQRKIVDRFPKPYYLTGITMSEIAQDDLQKLKQFIESQLQG